MVPMPPIKGTRFHSIDNWVVFHYNDSSWICLKNRALEDEKNSSPKIFQCPPERTLSKKEYSVIHN